MVEPTHLKTISQNGNLPQVRGENIKYLKPPRSKKKLLGQIVWETRLGMNLRGPVSSGTLERITKIRLLHTRCNNVCFHAQLTKWTKTKMDKTLCETLKLSKIISNLQISKKNPGEFARFFSRPGPKKNNNFGGHFFFPKKNRKKFKVPFPEVDPQILLAKGCFHPGCGFHQRCGNKTT